MRAVHASPAGRTGRAAIAERIARDIEEGWLVNLGVGIPTLVSEFVAPEREVIFHSENGIIGIGPAPASDEADRWLVNASKMPVSMRRGACLVHQADSFAIIRGGHLDLCVLGAYEVAENGDFANWAVSLDDPAPTIGGGMDLALGTKRLWIAMDHTTKDGRPRLLDRCTYPVTALGVVLRVYTDLAVVDVEPNGFIVREMVAGINFDELQRRTGARLHLP